MKRWAGYVLLLIGLCIVALGVKPFNALVTPNIPVIADIDSLYLIIAGIVVMVVGGFILKIGGRGAKQLAEVPIYHGKNIVGYRRH